MIKTLDSMMLKQVIIDDGALRDPDLDQKQCKWVMAAFDRKISHPRIRALIEHHKPAGTRALWTAIENLMKMSRAGIISMMNIQTYLTGTPYHLTNWRGTYTTYLAHWDDQVRQLMENASDDEKFSDLQLN